MKNNLIPMLLLISIMLVISCKTQKKQDSQTLENDSLIVYTLDFEKIAHGGSSDSIYDFVINDIAKEISFIPLEPSAEAWPGNMIRSMLTSEENYIISGMLPEYRINIYNLDGEHKENISRAGNGERELPDWPQGIFSNHHLERLCVRSSRKVLINSLDGEYIDNIHLSEKIPFVGDMVLLNSGDYALTPALYLDLGDNNIPYLLFMDENGGVASSLYYDYKRDSKQFSISESKQDRLRNRERNNLVSSYSGDALFREQFSDIVYKVESKESIAPYLNLERGTLMPTPADSFDPGKNKKKIYHNAIMETEKYVIVKYMYDLGIYTSIWDKKEESIVANLRIERDVKQDGLGYTFHTYYRISDSEKVLVNLICATQDKLYCLVEAEKACEFLPNIKEDDNHVIMIVELK